MSVALVSPVSLLALPPLGNGVWAKNGHEGLRLCGPWCDAAPSDARCSIDSELVPCVAEWCTTTCGRWASDVLHVGDVLVDCDAFAAGAAYPRGATPCPPGCLPPEVGLERYPMPTGLGLLCAPGSCEPAVQSRYAEGGAARGLGILRCPCNWYGSDCTDDLRPVLSIKKKLTFGDYQLITLEVNDVDWRAITSNHRPGAVVRLQALADKPDTSRSSMSMARSWAARRPLEQPLALANLLPLGVDDGTALPKTSVGELEVLVGLPDSHLNPEVTELLYRLRELPVGPLPISGAGALYVNPAVGGFYSREGKLFLEAIHHINERLPANAAPPEFRMKHSDIRHAVLVATGTGIAAMRPTIDALVRMNSLRQRILIPALSDDLDRGCSVSDEHGVQSLMNGAKGQTHESRLPVRVHLYLGIRSMYHLPYAEELASWAANGDLALTLLISDSMSLQEALNSTTMNLHRELLAAAERGERLMEMASVVKNEESAAIRAETHTSAGDFSRLKELLMETKAGKLYVHQALALDLSLPFNGPMRANEDSARETTSNRVLSLHDQGVNLENAVVAVCGRSDILGGIERAVRAACSARGIRSGAKMREEAPQYLDTRHLLESDVAYVEGQYITDDGCGDFVVGGRIFLNI